jgi:hypothetical protein
LYDLENCPKDITIEAEEELDEDDKGPTILKSEVVKAIKPTVTRSYACMESNFSSCGRT